MKYGYLISFILITFILSASCDSNSQNPNQSSEISIPDYQLCIVDSFGVEIGDSLNMIGSINGFCYHPDGSILILDRPALRIRVISDQGEVNLIGREGEGPGELLLPQGICVLQDGRILVSDEMKREVRMIYPETTLEAISQLTGMSHTECSRLIHHPLWAQC